MKVAEIQPEMQFKSWTVLEVAGFNRHNHRIFKCKCNCGVIKIIRGYSLTTGRSAGCQSCGNKKVDGLSSVRVLYKSYRISARRRKLEFKLEFEDFYKLTQENCYYCGIAPSRFFKSQGCAHSVTYNGIDRIDSNVGYVLINCVSCCTNCNYAKSNLSKREFFELIERIYNYSIIGKAHGTA